MEPFMGEITMFAGNFPPRSWAYCNGALLAISQNDALFSLLGTIYGGDGRTTFGLPDLRARIPNHAGTGPGLSNRRLGSKGGSQVETIISQTMPAHTHTVVAKAKATTEPLSSGSPKDAMLPAIAPLNAYNSDTPDKKMQTGSVVYTATNTGGSQAHSNLPPYLGINFIIALYGTYPSRN